MEKRCDQVLICHDESDKINCQTIFLEKSYQKTAPPVVVSNEDAFQKAFIKVTLTLLDIAAIRESNDEIYIKFTTELQWTEPRATYHNLKAHRYSLEEVFLMFISSSFAVRLYVLDLRLGLLVVCKHLTIQLSSLSPSLTSLHGVNLSFPSLCVNLKLVPRKVRLRAVIMFPSG